MTGGGGVICNSHKYKSSSQACYPFASDTHFVACVVRVSNLHNAPEMNVPELECESWSPLGTLEDGKNQGKFQEYAKVVVILQWGVCRVTRRSVSGLRNCRAVSFLFPLSNANANRMLNAPEIFISTRCCVQWLITPA